MEINGAEGPQIKKRKRTITTPPNLQMTECVREFKLPQAYPSMVSQTKKTPVNVTVERIKVPGGQSTLNLKVSSGKIDPNNKLQKLKLKAPDGRDLGEFDVQVLTQENKDNKTVSVAVKESKNISSTGIINNLNNPSSIKYIKKTVKEAKKQNHTPTHGVLIPISPVLINQKNYLDENSSTNDSDSNVKNSKVYVMQSGDNWQMIKQASDGKKIVEPVNSTHLKLNGIESIPNVNSKNLVRTLPAGMKIKVINRNMKQSPEVIINGRKRMQSGDECENSRKRLSYSPLPINSLMDSNGYIKLENFQKRNFDKDTYYVLPTDDVIPSIESFENKISGNSTEKIVNIRQSSPLRTSQGRINLLRREKRDPNVPSKSDCDSSINSYSVDLSSEKNGNNTLENNIDELSILGEALNSLSNEDLKRKALKALSECGIGFEKFIPKKVPLDQLSIRESQTQTPIFGVLCEDEFVKLSEDSSAFTTIPVKERQNNSASNNESKRQPFSEEDLDAMLNKWDVNKEKIKQVQNIMKFNPISERIYNLLEKDFCNSKKYDENGHLNIHKAVLNNHIAGIRRQLMILKACKINIDIPTENHETSLELALKYNTCEEIIRLLLSSGANPTSSKDAHDSALTIASKHSSPLFPLLIKHAAKPGDLNYLDSNGFAAIHYCAQNGNLPGVMALITANADLNVRDNKSGRTALFHALENDDLKLAKELLSHGAKPNIPNFSSQTVFHLIDDSKHVSLKEMLTKAMKM